MKAPYELDELTKEFPEHHFVRRLVRVHEQLWEALRSGREEARENLLGVEFLVSDTVEVLSELRRLRELETRRQELEERAQEVLQEFEDDEQIEGDRAAATGFLSRRAEEVGGKPG